MRAEHGASWRQETIHEVVGAAPIERAAEDGSRTLRYRIRLADGSTVELDADAVCERLLSSAGEQILLTAGRAAQILGRHMRAGLGGTFLPGITLTRVLGLFRRHWQEPLGHGEGSLKLKVSCDQVIGTGATVSARELAECGVLSDGDLERLAALKNEVFSANVHGTAADRASLVARVNGRWRKRNVRLVQRNNVVLPAFIAAPRPTRSLVVVLDGPCGIGRGPDAARQIRTTYPGRLLCDSPAHARYMPPLRISNPGAGTTIGELQRRAEGGEELSQREQAELGAYRHAFDVWYEHGLLLPTVVRRGHPIARRSS